MAFNPAWADPPIEDGVHLGLPFPKYINQAAMGSTDWMKLFFVKYGWWWQSRYNPRRKAPKTNPYQNYGSALHAIMLEGPKAYARQFAVQPDPLAYVDLCKTTEDVQLALEKAGYDIHTGTSKWNKAQWRREIADKLPDRPVWDTIMEDWQTEIGTRAVVSADEDWMLRFMQHMAIDPTRKDNAPVRRLLVETADHPALAEVSVFATIDGIRRRWRLDRMFPGATMDLKSLGNWRGRPLDFEVGQVATQNGWVIQRSDYEIGRAVAYELIKAGRLFGGTPEQRTYIRDIAEHEPDWYWLWLVYQKPESSSGAAPILMPVHNRRGSDRHMDGLHKLQKAITFYQGAVAEFGLDKPWGRVEPLHYTEELMISNVPQPFVRFPHWVAEDAPTEADAYPYGD